MSSEKANLYMPAGSRKVFTTGLLQLTRECARKECYPEGTDDMVTPCLYTLT